MSDPLYERYKEALRAGHVAVLRGRLDEAIEAYRAAAGVAPERALPHTSLGGVLLDLGRADDALAEFHVALEVAPEDEGALLGRSESLVRLEQPIAAAETLDTLAEVLLSAGRDADAVETLQRALVLEERVGRRRRYQRALRSLRMSAGDRESDEALGRALGVLDAPATSPAAEAAPAAVLPEPAAADTAAATAAADTAAVTAVPSIETVPGAAAEALAAEAEAIEQVVEPPPPPDPRKVGEAALDAGVAALAAGDRDAALAAYRDAARTFLAAGLLVAALDACRDAVQLDPDDVEVHLLYAAVFRARGWRDLATSRIVNILRLVDLDGDTAARARICAEVAAVHGEDEQLVGLCA